jgi:hypothetical protein
VISRRFGSCREEATPRNNRMSQKINPTANKICQARPSSGSDSFSKENGVSCLSAQESSRANNYAINLESMLRHKLTPADWGYGKMTVCIAAICHLWNVIVTASDMALSTDQFSADAMTIKTESIQPSWHVFFSGNDISPVIPIIRDATARFSNRENEIDQIMASFREAYQGQVQRRINDEVLGRYDFDLPSFKEHGLKQLGRDQFNSLCRQIDRIDFDCEFLVCGFDQREYPHVFTLSNPGKIIEYSKPGFWAIGSGAPSALSTLYFHSFSSDIILLPTAIYHICEAKFMAESALGVGSQTFAFVVHPSGEAKTIDHSLMAQIRNAWELYGKAKVPPDIEAVIQSKLKLSESKE